MEFLTIYCFVFLLKMKPWGSFQVNEATNVVFMILGGCFICEIILNLSFRQVKKILVKLDSMFTLACEQVLHVRVSQSKPLSYIIPWRSDSYTSFSNRSVAKNMADFGLCWRQIHAIWYLWLQVITTDQAQFWSRLNFHALLVFCRILFCFLSFRGIKFCRFFSVFSMFSGRLTICLSICKF